MHSTSYIAQTSSDQTIRRRHWFFEGIFLLLVALSCIPLMATNWLPMQDLPQHLAAIRVLHDYSSSTAGFSEWFELTPMSTQYIGFYMLASLLAFIFKVETATRILIVLSVASLPYCMRYLLRQLGRPQWLALFSIPLAYNTNLILGFLNFNAAIPLMLLGLGLSVGLRQNVSRRRAAAFVAVASACFLMHVLPFALLICGSVLMALSRDKRAVLQRLLPIAPVVVVAGVWSILSEAGGSTRAILLNAWLHLVGTPEPQASFVAWDKALREIPNWLLAVIHAPGEDLIAILLFALIALSFLIWSIYQPQKLEKPVKRADQPENIQKSDDSQQDSPIIESTETVIESIETVIESTETVENTAQNSSFWRFLTLWTPLWPSIVLLSLVVLSWALYFLLPQGYDWVWPIAPRFALMGLMLTVPLIPALPARAYRWAFMLALSVLIIWQSALMTDAFKTFERDEVQDFNLAVDALPENTRVAGLIFERGSRVIRFAPFMHSVALVQARQGGAVMFTFADFPQSPFRFKEENRPPRVPPRWEWTPDKVDPAKDLAWYDYVLVRGGPGKIRTQTDIYEPVYNGERWSVWRRSQ